MTQHIPATDVPADIVPSASIPSTDVRWPAGSRAAAAFTFDVDAESAVLSTAPALRDRVSTMSQLSYGPTFGVPRLIELLADRGVRSTFFVPGYTAERYPQTVEQLLAAGHEVAYHGYLHEPLAGKSLAEETAILERSIEVLERRFGVAPSGYRAPFWEMNWHTPALLAEYGFRYDSSLMNADHPYVLATRSGELVELPINWGLDDWGHYCFLPEISGNAQFTSPRNVAEMWQEDARAVLDTGGLWILTNHPFLSGRPARTVALGSVIDAVLERGDTWVTSLGEIADHVASLDLEPTILTRPQLDGDAAEVVGA